VTYLSESQINPDKLKACLLKSLRDVTSQHQGIADIKKDKEIETASLYINKILLQKVTQKY